jgi:hypothetical protein
MIPKSNPIARQLSSVPQTHRTSTLQAISQSAHKTTARIEFLKIEGQKIQELVDKMPEDASSRLAWLSSNLQSM